MTRKHFEAIAAILRATYTDSAEGERVAREIANDLADYFATENPRFDKMLFLTVAGF